MNKLEMVLFRGFQQLVLMILDSINLKFVYMKYAT